MSINGQYYIDQVALDRKTLYTNPYLIVTEAEYTKHYYAESQRIASKLGGGWAQAGYDPLQDHVAETPNFYYSELNNQLIDRLLENAKCVGVHDARYYDAFEAVYNQLSEHEPEVNQYFYHPDHLGSSSFITNASGDVDQHLQYLPFGEPWIDQRTSNNIRFTFSGKERDDETGYNYFGARYYNADISIWLSVDPLSDQAPGWTPYRYGFNNPIQFVDPNGMLETEFKNSKTNETVKVEDGMNQTVNVSNSDWSKAVNFSMNEDGNCPTDEYNNFISSNGGIAVPTEMNGGLIPNKELFLGFMTFKAGNEGNEVAAFEVLNRMTNDRNFIVQPWNENTRMSSHNDITFVERFGFSIQDIREEYHTHPNYGKPGGSRERGLSTGDFNVFTIWDYNIPINAIYSDGQQWRLSRKNGLIPRPNFNGLWGIIVD